MNKILDIINRLFPEDKAKHFIVGVIAAVMGLLVGSLIPGSVPLADVVLMTFCVGWLKEMRDAYNNRAARRAGEPEPNEVSFADFWYTLAGSAPVAIVLLVVQS